MVLNKQVSFTRFFCFLLVIILALGSGGGFNFDFIKESFAIENQKNSSSQVAGKQQYVEGEILVRFEEALSDFSIAENQELNRIEESFAVSEINPLIKGKNVLKGLKFSYSVKFNPKYSVKEVVREFEKLGSVENVEPNYIYQTTATPNDTNFDIQWYLKDSSSYGIETETAWDTQTGSSGVIVGVIDTGIDYNHPDLNGNMWPTNGYDFVNGDADPMDDHGHGTHCAGIVAAETNNATGVAGIAGGWGATPGTQLMALKAFNSGGTGDASDITNAINFAVTEDADILSMSFTSTSSSSSIQTALNNAYTAGLVLVAAAGNDNIAPLPFNAYPAKYSNVIGVTSTDSSGRRSSFANYGTWVDIAAPGSSIYSTVWNDTYTYKSGTSMACPGVAGVAALLKAQYPAWDKDQIMERLISTAQDVDSLNPSYKDKIGNGILNANSALGSMFWSNWSSNGATSSNVSMAVFSSKLYQAVKGSSTGTVYTRSSANGTSWSSWVGNGKTSSDVTMTVFGAKLYQAVRGYSTGTVYTRSSADGSSWSSWVGNGKTAGNVSMYVFNDGGGDDLFQAVRGAGADDIYTRSSANGTDWSAWTKNGKTAGDVSMYDFNPGAGNRLYQAVRGLGADDIYTRYTSNGSSWSNWSKNGKTSSNITMTVFSSKLYQAVAGYTNGTVCIRSTSDGTSWSGWAADGPTRSGGEVEMVVFDDGGGDKLYQSTRNAINGKVHNRVSADGIVWDTWIAYGKCIGNVEMVVFNGGAGNDLYQAVRGYSYNDVYTHYSVDDMP